MTHNNLISFVAWQEPGGDRHPTGVLGLEKLACGNEFRNSHDM